jgi:hypothetical protein
LSEIVSGPKLKPNDDAIKADEDLLEDLQLEFAFALNFGSMPLHLYLGSAKLLPRWDENMENSICINARGTRGRG